MSNITLEDFRKQMTGNASTQLALMQLYREDIPRLQREAASRNEDLMGRQLDNTKQNAPKTKQQPTKPAQAQPAPAQPAATKPKQNQRKKSVLHDFDKSISISKDGVTTFRHNTKGANGKTIEVEDKRKTYGDVDKVGDTTYIDINDIQKMIASKIEENNKQGNKTTITMGGNGKQLKLEVETGKQLNDKQLKELSGFLAAQSKIVMPAEKNTVVNEGGWFHFAGQKVNAKTGIKESADMKTQLAEDKRKIFNQEDKDTMYIGLSQMDISNGDFPKGPVAPDKVEPSTAVDENGTKKGLPKWVKALAIGGAIAAGVATVGLLAPAIMPAMSACWTMLPAAAGPALHGVQTAIAGASALMGNPLTFMPMSGRWIDALGTTMNAVPQGISLGSSILGVAGGVAAAAGAGILAYKAITGVYKAVSAVKERREAAERESAAPTK